jgi:hypothetical protein
MLRSVYICAIVLLQLTLRSEAILDVAVPVADMPAMSSIFNASMYVYGDTTEWVSTQVIPPSGLPANWIIEFSYDDELNTSAVDSILVYEYCNLDAGVAETVCWVPSPFTVFYQDGVFAIPTESDFAFDSDLCSEIDVFTYGTWQSITAGNGAWEEELLSNTSAGVSIDFTTNGFYSKTVVAGGQSWDRLSLGGMEGATIDSLIAQLPTYTVWIEIPDSGSVELGSTSLTSQGYADYHVYPYQPDSISSFAYDTTFYATDAWYPSENIFLGDPAIMRHVRGVPLTVCPFRYNPALDSLIVIAAAYVEVDFTSSSGIHELTQLPGGGLSPQDTLFYNQFFVNYERDDDMRTDNGLYLGITVSAYEDALDSMLVWKTMQGFETAKIVFTSATNAETLKDSIAYYYENFGVEYVLLMGDHSQLEQPWSAPVNGDETWHCWSDNWYAYMDESDDDEARMPDVLVGRMPVVNSSSSINELWYQVDKTIDYSLKPVDASWDNDRAILILPADSYLHNESLPLYDLMENRTVFDLHYLDGMDPNVTQDMLIAELNNSTGSGLFVYSGHGSTGAWGDWSYHSDNFDTADVLALESNKLGPVFAITCRSGRIETTTRGLGEAFLEQENGSMLYVCSTIGILIRDGTPLQRNMVELAFTGEPICDVGMAVAFAKQAVESSWISEHGYQNSVTRKDMNSVNIYGDPSLNLRQPGYANATLQLPSTFPSGVAWDFNGSVLSGVTARANYQVRVFHQDSLMFEGLTDANGDFTTEIECDESWDDQLTIVAYKPG